MCGGGGGWAMGVAGSIMAASIGVTTLFAGFVTQINGIIPFVASVLAYFVCIIWIRFF